MKGVARVGRDLVGGRAIITGPGVPTVLVNNKPISVVGDTVTPHGENQHASATIVKGTELVYANNKPISMVSGVASCGDVITSGSVNVYTM